MTTGVRQIQDRTFWLDFIEEYKLLPCLWDEKHSNFANKKIREFAFCILLKKLRKVMPEASLDVVKQRLNNFRRTFINEYNKVQESKKGGTNYVPSLYYYDHLKFLKENYDEVSETEEDIKEQIDNKFKYNLEEEDNVEELPDKINNLPSLKLENLPVHEYSNVSEEEPRPRKRKRYIQELRKCSADTIDSADDCELHVEDPERINASDLQLDEKTRTDDEYSEIEVLSDTSANAVFVPQCTETEDEFDVIAKRVATHFRKMDPQQCLYAEKLVFDVCISGRLNRLTEDSNLTYSKERNDNDSNIINN